MLHPASSNGVAFSAYNADTEDYYSFLPSDESMSDVEDEIASSLAAKSLDPVEGLVAGLLTNSTSKIMTRIGSLNQDRSKYKENKESKRTVEQKEAPALGTFNPGTKDEIKVSPRVLEGHKIRKTLLQDALDAATSGKVNGEAPFRFVVEKERIVGSVITEDVGASPAPEIHRVEGHAPEKKNFGKRRVTFDTREDGNYSENDQHDHTTEPDPLFDEQLDDADEQWVRLNLCGARGTPLVTDATLCCPCCFVTVCMACQRHVTYTNQYRATTAINCRVQREEIFTYASNENRASTSMPFQKRQNLNSDKAIAATTGQQIARLLQANEFYPVACSDCGTVVGVFDREQHYHFFNTLPSHC